MSSCVNNVCNVLYADAVECARTHTSYHKIKITPYELQGIQFLKQFEQSELWVVLRVISRWACLLVKDRNEGTINYWLFSPTLGVSLISWCLTFLLNSLSLLNLSLFILSLFDDWHPVCSTLPPVSSLSFAPTPKYHEVARFRKQRDICLLSGATMMTTCEMENSVPVVPVCNGSSETTPESELRFHLNQLISLH